MHRHDSSLSKQNRVISTHPKSTITVLREEKLLHENGLEVSFDDDNLMKFIAEDSFDIKFGARPIKRFIQKNVINELAKKIISGDVDKNKKIFIRYRDGLVIEN